MVRGGEMAGSMNTTGTSTPSVIASSIVATAEATELGQIQTMVGEAEAPETPMQKQLGRMGTQLALLSGPRLFYRWLKDHRLALRSGERVLIVGARGAGRRRALAADRFPADDEREVRRRREVAAHRRRRR